MAYETSNPAKKMAQVNGSNGLRLWSYTDGDPIATVRGAGYFSNAGDLGMEIGDAVIVYDDNLDTTTFNFVSAIAAGAATVVAIP